MPPLGPLHRRADPLMAFNFAVGLIDSASPLAAALSIAQGAVEDTLIGGFAECTGLEMVLEVESYKEGGRNDAEHRFATRLTWPPLVLKRGLGTGTALWDWMAGFADGWVRRRDGLVLLLDDRQLPVHAWGFQRGLPTHYTGPSLNAGQNAVAIESLEIQHEGLFQLPALPPPPAGVPGVPGGGA